MSADPSSSPALRASDADRDRVIETLRTAVADGRLDPVEFDERLDAVLAARTVDALAPLTADLVVAQGREVAVASPHVVQAPRGTKSARRAERVAGLVAIREKHGIVRRDGDWTLPQRLELRTSWSQVTLDLTTAVRSGPELVIEMRVQGGNVELILLPGMVVDSNELAVRYGELEISRDAGDTTPTTLRIRLVGRVKHGRIVARWQK